MIAWSTHALSPLSLATMSIASAAFTVSFSEGLESYRSHVCLEGLFMLPAKRSRSSEPCWPPKAQALISPRSTATNSPSALPRVASLRKLSRRLKTRGPAAGHKNVPWILFRCVVCPEEHVDLLLIDRTSGPIPLSSSSLPCAEKLKSHITTWKAKAKGHFFVAYSIPEVGPKDNAMRIKCESWNKNIRQICSDIGAHVEFVNVTKALQHKMRETSYREAPPTKQPPTEGMECKPNHHHYDCPGTGNTKDGQSANTAEALLEKDLKKKTAHCCRILKRAKDIQVGFFNLHGAQTGSKWEEVYWMMDDEDIVAETHLRVMEGPPVHPRLAVGWLRPLR
ncbi:hypothetical protein HPB50_003013 [Hyalomma asiaticum]|uniref:Uncharacterized protein n=1 Tax=Hyalomma asiaticum TaxID=266040 RepID=A0ACB7T0Z7_HYAAI|nr:hypothetical protein HPB50_003013 [Hyalomma asiaticum]